MELLQEKLRGLSLSLRSVPEEPSYLLHLSLQTPVLQPTGLLAVSCSNFTLHLHQKDTLSLLGEFNGHSGPICGITFSRSSPHLLYSASADGTVRGWDVRMSGGMDSVQVFRSDPSHSFCSFDLSCSDLLLCTGTEQVEDEDSFLLFWDARQPGGGVLGAYSESHSDDITQVRFHPQDKDRLASSSTDGLVNVFDLSHGAEEDALRATCNSDSSVGNICWCGADYNRLLCLSHDEGLHLWDLAHVDTDEPLTVFRTQDARGLTLLPGSEKKKTEGGVDYLVGGAWLEQAQRLLVVGGMTNGDLHLLELNDSSSENSGLQHLRSLEGGHSSTVRCFLWDATTEVLVTGGEDAQLLLWKPGGKEENEEFKMGKRKSMKSESTLKFKSRPHRKHGYQKEKNKTKKQDTEIKLN